MGRFLLGVIGFYQRWLSFDKGVLRFLVPATATCRFQPSCSEYFSQALERYGVCRGSWRGLCRFLRCHPLSPGGYDPLT